MESTSQSPPKTIVIVGGGIAGMEIATMIGRMQSPQLRACLIDKDVAHIWKPMLHTIAAGTREASQEQTVYAAHARHVGYDFQLGEMEGLDRQRKEIHLTPITCPKGRPLVPGRIIRYDLLVLAVGNTANTFGTPGADKHCMMIDSRQQANHFNQEVRTRILESIGQNVDLHLTVVGGGATGVELAAELIQLTEFAGMYSAQDLLSKVHITLVESNSRLLAAFPEKISSATKARLESLGVTVLLQTRVRCVEADKITLADGAELPSSLTVWAAGVKAPVFLSDLDGLEINNKNQLLVSPTLQTLQDPSIYAVGDCANVIQTGTQSPLPPTAQIAHQQAKYFIQNLPSILNGDELHHFESRNNGLLVSLGNYGAFGKLGFFDATFIKGKAAQVGHAMLYRSHQSRLHGFLRGNMIWLVDKLNARLRPRIKMD
ncbi:NAD(P)/FAD-dependent oxidoreductase [Halopseudomonas pelagia]|uniref:NAD(P)/FAD-dependent oxidoreductase n=1 Tax=Halopseudomonas pelagia TaxID=553151 RepID=UPI0030DD39FF|tara:strand:+ start:8924 stop:10216 length:1293 start_codon:yes stop_codon:yes gene_type:complete